MNQHLSIITGASRGLGSALALQLLAHGHHLVCLSRSVNLALDEASVMAGLECAQWPANLADPAPVAARLATWLAEESDPQRYASVTLINNAALLAAPGPLDRGDAQQLSAVMRVGLEAPLLLSAAFLRATREWPGQKRVLNISSGLGRRALAGSASYCAIKAGLDHLSRALALDEALQPNGARVVSLAPGVIDTDMQAQLRAAGPEGFPDHDMFVEWQRTGQLSTPADAAARIVAWMESPAFGAEVIADIRTL